MASIEEAVLAIITPDEPNYNKAFDLPPEALPALAKIAGGDDALLASKAVWLASRTGQPEALQVVEIAAGQKDPVVRVAAAGALRNIAQPGSDKLLERLLADEDAGVRKLAVQSAAALRSPKLPEILARISESDPEPALRDYAKLLGSQK